jgi:phosphatidylinositol alpha 1,6-mannosyltransferase
MRVVISAETFLPRMNGVVNSVIQVARYLRDQGVPVLIIAPDLTGPREFEGIPVERVRSVTLPGVHDFDVSVATHARVARILESFQPTVVHLASPFVLGGRVAATASAMGIPTVAVFQTDIAGYAQHYGLAPLAFIADAVIKKIHGSAAINLVPSTACESYLTGLGVDNVHVWRRGVDQALFNPARRSPELRRQWDVEGRTVVGYLGRLAPEKNVHSLAMVAARPDMRLVIVGEGPCRDELQAMMPSAVFTGRLAGDDLGATAASFDVLVAPGEHETFCQVVQESMASGVPVVAPAIGGPLDLIDTGVNGFLYPAGNPAAMVECVAQLARDEMLRHRFAAAGLLAVENRSWRALGHELYDHYLAAAGSSVLVTAA